jgi:hypothetical protein
MPDLPVRRVPAIAEGVDHGVLEVGPAPPCDEAVRGAIPRFALAEGCHGLRQSLLHIDDGAILIERQCFDFALEDLRVFHVRDNRPATAISAKAPGSLAIAC